VISYKIVAKNGRKAVQDDFFAQSLSEIESVSDSRCEAVVKKFETVHPTVSVEDVFLKIDTIEK
jgi:hypothetical protein